MLLSTRRLTLYLFAATTVLFFIYAHRPISSAVTFKKPPAVAEVNATALYKSGLFEWSKLPQRYPVAELKELPSGPPVKIPKIQYDFSLVPERREQKNRRKERQQAVKETFQHAWKGYKEHAWLKDEVAPISGGAKDTFGGWAATLVDSLDTLWIMGLYDEFSVALAAVEKINFSASSDESINCFETVIRYLGGFLSAYDLTGRWVLLQKAIELGDMMYATFDTPNRMPITRWHWQDAIEGKEQDVENALISEIGSLSLEFTRLSQLTGNPKYFDAIQRVTDAFFAQQNITKLPGMWPVVVDVKHMDFTGDNTFSLGAMSDSFYEYLPKEYLLLGGQAPEYRTLYEGAINAAKKYLFFRPYNKDNLDILISGTARVENGEVRQEASGQHLTCFTGGMVGIGAKIFENEEELKVARRLTDGCVWTYESMPSGIGPEIFTTIPCEKSNCTWDETVWHDEILRRNRPFEGSTVQTFIENGQLQPGFIEFGDRRYVLRPEAIESVFILYRITGDKELQEKAWKMFEAIKKHTKTPIAHAALLDITKANPVQYDSMESFWTAETLKYFYLIFSEPNVISLDDYVFNTEAHPLKTPKPSEGWFNWWR